MNDLRYPIGKFSYSGPASDSKIRVWIGQIAELPGQLRAAVDGLSRQQLDTPYRPGGWTVRQVIHHLPDSHINSYVRFRMALTEDEPEIKPYQEDRWAELTDARTAAVEMSLELLDALHRRWSVLLNGLGRAELARAFRHPELGLVTLERNVALYAWHGRHHLAQIAGLKERMEW